MPCYTRIRVTVPDDAITQKAVAKLGFRYEVRNGCVNRRVILGWKEKGYANATEAATAIKTEAGVMRAIQKVQRLAPNAVIQRKGNQLRVTVSV